MKKVSLILVFILFSTATSLGQVNEKEDTLFIFNKKFALSKCPTYLTPVLDFPFSVFSSQYKGSKKKYEYNAIIKQRCAVNVAYNLDGNEIIQESCDGKEKVSYVLPDFVDSLECDLKAFQYTAIKIKQGHDWAYISKTQYKAIYDSVSVTIILNQLNPQSKYYLSELLNGYGTPKLILIEAMFYNNKKNTTSYYLPCGFVIKPH